MVIDERRDLALGVPEPDAAIRVQVPQPAPGAAYSSRRLALRGEPAFELALWCGTCPAIFQKLSEPEAADLGVVNERLRTGLDAIDDGVLASYSAVLPASTYRALLLEMTPQLVRHADASDYFTHEQVGTWGAPGYAGAGEDPRTPYYRTFETPVDEHGHLYEFVIPMVPPQWNDRARVAEYAQAESGTPTAVAYSLLDIVHPIFDEGTDRHVHWVLMHFLLDGHHKFEAAAAAGRPVRLLSLLDENMGLASPASVDTMVQARGRARVARVPQLGGQ